MASRAYTRSRDLTDNALKAESLLNRYPDINEEELAGLIRAFAHLPLLDFGLLANDDRVGDKLDAFYRDHGDKLLPPVTGLMWALAVPAALAIGLLFWAVV